MERAGQTRTASPEKIAATYVEHVLAGRLEDAVAEAVGAIEALGGSLARLYDDVLRVAASRIGDLWHLGRITVADEHFATSALREAMAAAKRRYQPEEERADVIVLACPPDEAHDVGLKMLADALDVRGFDVRLLGPQTPADATADYARRHRASLVALSCTTPIGLGGLMASISALREVDPDLPVLVGGRCLELFPDVLGGTFSRPIAVRVATGVAEIERILSGTAAGAGTRV